jgi:hypothetical protein
MKEQSAMIFINNKYTIIYYKIIDRAKTRNLTGYKERHHIVPKSLGGSNDINNIVNLTPKEHFICHLLLTKMVDSILKKKMTYAVWLMCNVKNHNQPSRYVPNSNTYQLIRKQHSKNVSEKQAGRKKNYSSFAGRKHSNETLILQRKCKLGNNNPNFGVVQKPEWNEKKSISQKGISKPKLTCEICGTVVGGHGNYIRWHGSNCTLNKLL